MLYTEVITINNKINLKDSLFSGQSFLWTIDSDIPEYYVSVKGRSPVIIRQISDNILEIQSTSNTIGTLSLSDFITSYLSLDIDIDHIFLESFPLLYQDLWMLLGNYLSLRILRQDPFETMISFMCAQGIGMHLVRKQVSMILQDYGEKTSITLAGKEIPLHIFPTPEGLAAVDPLALSNCTNNNRIRATNIVLAAQGVAEGRINFAHLGKRELPLSELRNTLCQNRGIGFKIADCIALFGLGRFDAFPIDTHVKQYLGKWFNSTTALRSLTPASYLTLDAEARTFLNPDFAGYAGHILFHCWRKEVKKLRSF
ncbi:MAG: DNA-3-methyladenine glycosylase family protein [Chlorobium sp.]